MDDAAPDLMSLPDDLPIPADDGGAGHLAGTLLPAVPLPATDGSTVDLAARSRKQPMVVFAYPRTGRPGDAPLVPDWDDIPGARGCTSEVCSFRDLAADFAAIGAAVCGLSTQDMAYQREAVERLALPYPLLSDADLELATAIGLPTMEIAGVTLLKRLTMILAEGRIDTVIYPVFPPDRAAAEAMALLTER
ncbi:MAG: peroxiredoxin [Acidimicrobiia bacterium]|nr:peroxiredoxin [Acidimicrobiia bacterium]